MQINIRALFLTAAMALLATVSQADTTTYGHNVPVNSPSFGDAGSLFVNKVTVTKTGTLAFLGVLTPQSGSNANLAIYKADGAGGAPGTLITQTGSFALVKGHNEVSPPTRVILTPGDYWIGGVSNASFPLYGVFQGGVTLLESHPGFTATLPPTWPGSISNVEVTLSFYIKVGEPVIRKKGDAVPDVADKTFTSFGVPAVNESEQTAYLGKWSGGAGIFAHRELVAKVGDVITGTSAIKSFKDPVIDDAGHVAFPCTLTGAGISKTNDAAIVSNAPGGTLAIVAQEGTQAAGAPAGAVWKSFTSTAVPGGSRGLIILGTMLQGAGGITAANDYGVWAADAAGVLHLVLQEGTTVIDGNTVKSFTVLKAVSGSPGQTHAHNTHGILVSKVIFSTGEQAMVQQFLP